MPFFHKVPPTREKTPDLGGSGAFRIKRDQFLGFLPFEWGTVTSVVAVVVFPASSVASTVTV